MAGQDTGSVVAPAPTDVLQLDDVPQRDDIAELATTFSDLMRAFTRARQQYLARDRTGGEWTLHILLSRVVNEGPLRASALAEMVDSDPSTVSRQVAQLVKDGCLERRSDPADGRASLLVASERGQELHREHLQVRNEHFRQMLDEWGERDIRSFSELLHRFTVDFENNRKTWFDEDTDPTRDAASTAPQRES
jgi:DNA-binding MarR family transcriptional regulator